MKSAVVLDLCALLAAAALALSLGDWRRIIKTAEPDIARAAQPGAVSLKAQRWREKPMARRRANGLQVCSLRRLQLCFSIAN